MFSVVNASVNEERYMNKLYIRHFGNMYYGYTNSYECLYGENFISKNTIGSIKFDDLPKNLQTLRNLLADLTNQFPELVFLYRYNEFKGTLQIDVENYSFGNEDSVHLFVSNATYYDESVKDIITTLNDPENKLISDTLLDLKYDFNLHRKASKDPDAMFTFNKISKTYAIGIRILYPSQLGDQRIQNLINNRLYSKYFITEPMK